MRPSGRRFACLRRLLALGASPLRFAAHARPSGAGMAPPARTAPRSFPLLPARLAAAPVAGWRSPAWQASGPAVSRRPRLGGRSWSAGLAFGGSPLARHCLPAPRHPPRRGAACRALWALLFIFCGPRRKGKGKDIEHSRYISLEMPRLDYRVYIFPLSSLDISTK